MKRKTKSMGCRVEESEYERIRESTKKNGINISDYLRNLINKDRIKPSADNQEVEYNSLKDVNTSVNMKISKDDSLDIDEKVDRVLARFKWDEDKNEAKEGT